MHTHSIFHGRKITREPLACINFKDARHEKALKKNSNLRHRMECLEGFFSRRESGEVWPISEKIWSSMVFREGRIVLGKEEGSVGVVCKRVWARTFIRTRICECHCGKVPESSGSLTVFKK